MECREVEGSFYGPLTLRVWYLSAFLRGLREPKVWTVSRETAERLETVLANRASKVLGFFCFDDDRGTSVALNLKHLQAVRILWEPLRLESPPKADYEPAAGAELYLVGKRSPVIVGACEDEEPYLTFDLELAGGGEFVSWLDEDGEMFHVSTDHLVLAVYPSEWDELASKRMNEEMDGAEPTSEAEEDEPES